jgi:crotonobetainyl-CoA:carnitine CoA-transferase CaiB-like acyl-CoA transferase
MSASSTHGCSPFFSANSIVLRSALSLDLKKPQDKRILEDLIRNADVMDWMGLGYDRPRGNRSPYRLAAPRGAYRTRGEDSWIAIAAFTDEQWRAVASGLGHPEWLDQRQMERQEEAADGWQHHGRSALVQGFAIKA